MKKTMIKNIFKITFLSLFIIWVFNIWLIVIEAWNNANNNSTKNENNFKKLESSDIAKTWVAITINLSTRYGDKGNITDTIFKKIYTAKEVLENLDLAKDELIAKDMLATKEYFSILKTDFKQTLKTTTNKESTLNEIISQLKIRYNLWVKQIKNITTQKDVLVKEMEKIENDIKKIKEKINLDFKATKTDEIKKDIDIYLKLKNNYYKLRTFVIFENKFLSYYSILNNYNKQFLESFSLNRDIILKGSYLVIPNSWSNLLKDYWLLYSQSEYEEIQNKKKD